MIQHKTVGEWVRDHLLEVGEDYAHHMHTEYKAFILAVSRKRNPHISSYQAFRTLLWTLKKLGLVEPTRREKGHGLSRRQYYRVSGDPNDPGWRNPTKTLYG